MTETAQGGRQLLVDWANEQDAWVRTLAAEVLTTRRALGELAVEGAYQVLLPEKGLASERESREQTQDALDELRP